MGNAFFRNRDYAGAKDAFEKALSLDPKNALALNNLAWLYATCGDKTFRNPKKAVPLAKRANDMTNWKNPDYIDTYAAALEANGKHADAAIAEQQAVTLAPFDATLRQALAKYLAAAGKSGAPGSSRAAAGSGKQASPK